MNWKLTAFALVAIVVAVFFVPIVPSAALFPSVAQIENHYVYFHYYRSISGVFTPYGTSFYDGRYYFSPNPLSGLFY